MSTSSPLLIDINLSYDSDADPISSFDNVETASPVLSLSCASVSPLLTRKPLIVAPGDPESPAEF